MSSISYLFARELKKLGNVKGTIIPIVIGALGAVTKGTGGFHNNRTNGDHPNYCIVDIGLNTKKSPGDLRKLTVTQTPVRNNQLTLVGYTRKGENDTETIGGLGDKRTSGDHPNYSIAEIGQNIEKSPGDLSLTCCHLNSSEKPSANAAVKTQHITTP